jgi:hypothetical protein
MPDLPRWRSVPDAHDYLISDEGEVRRILADGTWRTIRGSRNNKGYRKVDLWVDDPDRPTGRRRWQQYVHNLVLLAFVGPRPEDHDGDHIDGDQLNNTLPNLRWRPAEENRWDWHGPQWRSVPTDETEGLTA